MHKETSCQPTTFQPTTLTSYRLDGQVAGECAVAPAFFEDDVNAQLVKDYLIALRANARQWSANTKGRYEVAHSNKKPHRQKGTGNARQGTLAAPQYKGGGRVFGPKPKFDQHVRINRRERRAAMRRLFAEKMMQERLVLVDDFSVMQAPKTKKIVEFLECMKITPRSVLFVGDTLFQEGQAVATERHVAFQRSVRNLPCAHFMLASQVNGYDLACAHTLVMTQAAFMELTHQLVAT